jgi:drug/metabolite transporter (DMT)-like permease
MNRGPVSLTTLIGNCSLLVSVIVCFILWEEPISLVDIVGLVLLMLGLTLTTYKKTSGKFKKGWAMISLLFLLLGAGVGIVFKAFSKRGGAKYTSNIMVVAAFVMLISYTLICFFTGSFPSKSIPQTKKEKRFFIIFALGSGLLSCVYNRLNIYLSGVLNGIIFFPLFNGGVVLLSTALGILIFKEKLSKKQLSGVLLGILGICIIGVF